MKFIITRSLTFNLTGFDNEPATFSRGEHEVATPAASRLAEWLERNPEFGSVIDEGTTGGAEAPATEPATPVVPPDEPEQPRSRAARRQRNEAE